MVCWQAHNAKPISQRVGSYSALKPLTKMTRQSPRSSHLLCENHAPIAVARCASSKASDAGRSRDPAHHLDRLLHDETLVTIQRPYPEQHRFPGQYRHACSGIYNVQSAAIASNRPCKRCASTSDRRQNQKTLFTLDQSPQRQLNAFPIGLIQTPRLPPSHVSQRRPPSLQNENLHSGPHRKTLNKAIRWIELGRRRYGACCERNHHTKKPFELCSGRIARINRPQWRGRTNLRHGLARRQRLRYCARLIF